MDFFANCNAPWVSQVNFGMVRPLRKFRPSGKFNTYPRVITKLVLKAPRLLRYIASISWESVLKLLRKRTARIPAAWL